MLHIEQQGKILHQKAVVVKEVSAVGLAAALVTAGKAAGMAEPAAHPEAVVWRAAHPSQDIELSMMARTLDLQGRSLDCPASLL